MLAAGFMGGRAMAEDDDPGKKKKILEGNTQPVLIPPEATQPDKTPSGFGPLLGASPAGPGSVHPSPPRHKRSVPVLSKDKSQPIPPLKPPIAPEGKKNEFRSFKRTHEDKIDKDKESSFKRFESKNPDKKIDAKDKSPDKASKEFKGFKKGDLGHEFNKRR